MRAAGVMALWPSSFLGSTPIGAPLIGFLAEQYGARFALGVGGVATLGDRRLGGLRPASHP